ncbi:DNA-binding response regulator [Anaerocolumna cellulosilytica]|uniref:Stage 0 sporulation protein A homolog n=1 Tax=Anaerocolumna cellulosilytica TaxID=433286 RepID=A0A6S6R9C6_9FIRM|nr:response regulator [Anaerocolumna cellulosilytica]MBB5195340.1 two-component system response regulator YesN [Anaerocolumna cellulosilytica]BCJ95872.1 DNA-binding response regulator [Anaerocolumna cellulosilytica]
MYKLLIIDDEPIVREGIRTLLSWESMGLFICGEGCDGKDGLQKIIALNPDLVLIDIKMPGMSGLEVIKQAKEQGFDGKIIILTGHSDFEFAKSAISLGVRAYLLKPIDEEELEESIRNMVEELEAKKNLDAYFSNSELKAKKELLRRLLLYKVESTDIRGELKQYGLNYHMDNYSVAILSQKRKLFQELEPEEMRKEEAALLGDVERLYLEDKEVFIGKGYTYERFREILKQYSDKRRNINKDKLFITLGHTVNYWEDIHFSYECAKMLSAYQFLYEEADIIDITILRNPKIIQEESLIDLLGSLVEIGDITGIKEVLQRRREYYRVNLWNEADVKVKITQNLIKIHHRLEKNYEIKKQNDTDINDVIELIKNSYTLEIAMEREYEFLINLSSLVGGTSSDNVIKRMLTYMEKNYRTDLKLESIARMFNYNSAYLGKIFKKGTGESFNNVLDSIRIKNAKRLLTESDLKVYQVSEQVGYSNIDYFYSKFKKYVGLSPKEFKNK